MKQQRIYIVAHGDKVRLVRAPHRAQALAHVANSIINVSVATQDELVKHISSGVAVESVAEADTKDLFESQEAVA
jgi:hypothetical protein